MSPEAKWRSTSTWNPIRATANDHHLLDDYFESVRQAESDLTAAESWLDHPKPIVDAAPPNDIHDSSDLIGRAKRMVDLIPLIVQTDSSRVITLMVQDHYVVPKVEGMTGNHHNLSHHGQDPSKIAQLEKVETRIVDCFGSLLTPLKDHPEGDGTLLDHTSVLFGSNLGNANSHHSDNLPILLAGEEIRHGHYIKQPDGTPLCNLYVSLLNRMGVDSGQFGQSTGNLHW